MTHSGPSPAAPTSTSGSTRRPPMKPVAPVTKQIIGSASCPGQPVLQLADPAVEHRDEGEGDPGVGAQLPLEVPLGQQGALGRLEGDDGGRPGEVVDNAQL